MARNGLQFEDVETAALQLKGSGKLPTVDGIRELLGTGSKTTISNHLRAWRSKQGGANGELPHELQALVTGLWARLNDEADLRIKEAESATQRELLSINQDMALLQQHYTALQNAFQQSEARVGAERLTNTELNQALTELKQNHIKLEERYQAALKQTEKTADENTRLHKLAASIQTNLEQYQQEVHERQSEQKLILEKMQASHTTEISQLKHQYLQQEGRIRLQELEITKFKTSLEQSEKQYTQLQIEYKMVVEACQTADRERSVLQEREDKSNKLIRQLKMTEEEDAIRIRELEKHTAVIESQLDNLRRSLQEAKLQISSLQNEKSQLSDEKAKLMNFLQPGKMDLEVAT